MRGQELAGCSTEIGGMFVEFREKMRGVTQVLLSSVNEGEEPGAWVNDKEVWWVVLREKA